MPFYKEITWKKGIVKSSLTTHMHFGGSRETLQTSLHRTWPGKGIKRKYMFFGGVFFDFCFVLIFCFTVVWKRELQRIPDIILFIMSALWGEIVSLLDVPIEGASIMQTVHCTMVGLNHVERTKTDEDLPKTSCSRRAFFALGFRPRVLSVMLNILFEAH